MMVVSSNDVTELAVCVDCALLIATGAVEDGAGNDITEAVAARVLAVWPEGVSRMVMASDDHSWFSKSACDCCGSTDHGERLHAVALGA